MATLQSPGVQVTVVDQSFYATTALGTVPMIFVASSANKQAADGSGIAQGTLAEKAGNVYAITSQRDLSATFGTPYFQKDSSGNAVNGGEINEYGLQAAYSALGITSLAYIVRANVDLSQLSGQSGAPTGSPIAGTYWLDPAISSFGIQEWNSTTLAFTAKTPLIIDNDNMDMDSTAMTPNANFGIVGSYAMYVTSENQIQLWYKNNSNLWVQVNDTFDSGKNVVVGPHYQYPSYTNSTPTGSIWIVTTNVANGSNWIIKYYNGSTLQWNTVAAPLYTGTQSAIAALDAVYGGASIPVGTLFVDSGIDHATDGTFKIYRRNANKPTSISSIGSTYTNAYGGGHFYVRETLSTGEWGPRTNVIISAGPTDIVASLIPAAISAAGLTNLSATYNSATKTLIINHALGGEFEITDDSGLLAAIGFVPDTTVNLYSAAAADTPFTWRASNWKPLSFYSSSIEPAAKPADGTLWYDTDLSADIMINDGTKWCGYRTVFPDTDPNGPLIEYSEPTVQSTGSALVDGDIWISTADIDNFVNHFYVYKNGSWVNQDTTDHVTPNGWVFTDARWSTNGGDGTLDYFEPGMITDLLDSNYVDPDVVNPRLYPVGTRLFNTRRSGFNSKRYMMGHIDIYANNGLNIAYNNEQMDGVIPYFADRWVTASVNNELEQGTFGRLSQRAVVVEAMKAAISANTIIRDTDNLTFNLIVCPGYPEVIADMVALNTDRAQTAFIIGDTPFRLKPTGTDLQAYGSNSAMASGDGDQAATTFDDYLALFYPSGLTNDNTGANIVVPPSHMMLRTFLNSDNKSYPWFAPAGTRRGTVDNATSVGYIDASGSYITASLYQGLRDVMQKPTVEINPIATLPGVGLVNFGQKTRHNNSALDRINVARLISYIRYQLGIISKPFLFEPNDSQTRAQLKGIVDAFLLEIVSTRGIYDFISVCDLTNNTPARIDRNELWLDVAIEPVKAVEFIYIPLRILNTGSIEAGNFGNLSTGNNA